MVHDPNIKVFWLEVAPMELDGANIEVWNPVPEADGKFACLAELNDFDGTVDCRQLEAMRDCIDKAIEEMKKRMGQF